MNIGIESHMRRFQNTRLIARYGVWLLLLTAAVDSAAAQDSSLFRRDLPVVGPKLTLANSSWLYQPVEPPRVPKLNDTITVVVVESSQVNSEAALERRKQSNFKAALKDWVELDGLSLKAAPQASGDPTVAGDLQSQIRAEADLETRDAMRFRIAARVVDIRPNGHLVLEAHHTIKNNEEQWDLSLSGIVSPDDVLPNRTVLSEDIAELSIHKRERGIVRDGYSRGWLSYYWDKYKAF